MKRSYVIMAILFFGTVAGAHMITPAPGATVPVPPHRATLKASEPVPAATMVSQARAPVPLLLPSRPPANVPTADLDPSASDTSQMAAKDGGGLQNESFARAAIEQDGYKGVRGLSRGSDGMWHGQALRGTTEVAIIVDAGGNVSTQ